MPKSSSNYEPNMSSITYWRKFAQHRFLYMFLAIVFAFGIVAYFGVGTNSGNNNPGYARSQEIIAVVNDEPITRAEFDQVWNMQIKNLPSGSSEVTKAMMQGQILNGQQQQPGLIDMALLRSIARKQGVKVTDADVDKQIKDFEKRAGGKSTKAMTEDELAQMMGVEPANLRNFVKLQTSPQLLFDSYTAREKVTEEDVLKTFDEIKVRHILISNKTLPDEQAKTKAQKILDEAKSGVNFAALANKNTDDPGNSMDPKTGKKGTKQGGLYDWAPAEKYDPAFSAAALALKPGQISDLVKTQFGYHIIKLEGSRRNLPKDYSKNKAELINSIRKQKAYTNIMKLMQDAKKTMKIAWKDTSMQWRYDFAINTANPMAMMQPDTQNNFLNELRTYIKKSPEDSTANLVLAQMLQMQYRMMGFSPGGKKQNNIPELDKIRNEMITAYELGLRHGGDIETEFVLAQLYEESKQPDKALLRYKDIQRSSKWDDTADRKPIHMQLLSIFKKYNQPDLVASEEKKLAELTVVEQKEAQKKAEEARLRNEEEKKRKSEKSSTGSAVKPLPESTGKPLTPGQ